MVTASRQFVCVRPQTYESAAEGEVLLGLYPRQMDALRNTVFALLDPAGDERLARTGRSPSQVWRSPADFAEALDGLAAEFEVDEERGAPALPLLAALPIALNVAACDDLPLVVWRATEDEQRDELDQRLRAIAWSDAHIGQWQWVEVREAAELGLIEELDEDFEGVAFLAPDEYARGGRVLAQLAVDVDATALARGFDSALASFEPPRTNSRRHLELGRREGIRWEGEIPVSDPQAPENRRGGR